MKVKRGLKTRVLAFVLALVMIISVSYIDGWNKKTSARGGVIVTGEFDDVTITLEGDGIPTIEFDSGDLGGPSTSTRNLEATVLSPAVYAVEAPNIIIENDLDSESEYKDYVPVAFFTDNEYSKELTTDVKIEEGDVKQLEIGKSYNLYFAFEKTIAEGEYEYKEITKGAVYSINYVNVNDALKFMLSKNEAGRNYSLSLKTDKTNIKKHIVGYFYDYVGDKDTVADISSSEWNYNGEFTDVNISDVTNKTYHAFYQYKIDGTDIKETGKVGNGLDPVPAIVTPSVTVTPEKEDPNKALIADTKEDGVIVSSNVSNLTALSTVTVTFKSDTDNTEIETTTLDGIADVKEEEKDAGRVVRSLSSAGDSTSFVIKNANEISGAKNYIFAFKAENEEETYYALTINYTDVNPAITVTKPETKTVINLESEEKTNVPVEASASIKGASTLSAIVSARYFNDEESKDLTVGALKDGNYPITGNVKVENDGVYKYKIEVTNNEGVKAVSDEFEIVKDTVKPEITDLTIKQDGNVISSAEKVTSAKDVEVSFKVSDSGSGVKEVTFDGTALVPDSNGIYKKVIEKAALEKNKEYQFTVIASDVAANKNDSIVTISTYEDNVDIELKEVSVNDEKKTVNISEGDIDPENNITNSEDLTFKFDIKTDVLLTDSVIAKVKINASEQSVDPADIVLTKAASKSSDSYYHSTLSIHVKLDKDAVINGLSVGLTNVNGVSNEAKVGVVNVDMTAPNPVIEEVAEETSKGFTVDGKDWYKKLVVKVNFADTTEGSYKSGTEAVTITGVKDEEGKIKDGKVLDLSSGTVVATIKDSATIDGTLFKVWAKDKAGNEKETEDVTFYVDSAVPAVKEGKNLSLGSGIEKDKDYQTGNPEISFEAEDNLGIYQYKVSVKCASITKEKTYVWSEDGSYKDGTADYSDVDIAAVFGKKNESSLYPEDGTYVVNVTAYDRAGNEVKALEKKVTVDNTIPKNDIKINNNLALVFNDENYIPQATDIVMGYNYGKFYNKELNLDFFVTDANVKKEDITVTEKVNGTEETVSLEWKDTDYGWYASYVLGGEGEHLITIQAKDQAENISVTKNILVVIDETKPSAVAGKEFKIGDGSKVQKGDPEIVFDAVDNAVEEGTTVSGIYEYVVKVDSTTMNYTGDTEQEASLPSVLKLSTVLGNTPAEGEHTVSIEVKDRAGNVYQAGEKKVIIDNTAPVAEITGVYGTCNYIDQYSQFYTSHSNLDSYFYGVYYTGVVKIGASIKDNHLSTDKAGNIVFTDEILDADGNVLNEETKNIEVAEWEKKVVDPDTYYIVKDLEISEEGRHRISIKARDDAGNESEIAEVSFVIDGTNPSVEEGNELKIGDGSEVQKADPGIAFKAVDKAASENLTFSGIHSYTVKVDGKEVEYTGDLENEASLPSDLTLKTVLGADPNEGEHKVSVKAVDRAGNVLSIEEKTVIIDNTKPMGDIEVSVDNSKYYSVYNENYTANGLIDNYTYGKYYQDTVKYSVFIQDEYLSDEVKNNVKLTDELLDSNGNVVQTKDIEVEMAKEEYTAEENVGRWVKTKYKDKDSTEEKNGYKVEKLSISEEGRHRLTLVVTDEAGNQSELATATFLIDKTAPSIINLKVGNGEEVQEGNPKIEFKFEDNPPAETNIEASGLYSYSVQVDDKKKDDKASGITMAEVLDVEKPEDGEHVITVYAYDKAGNTQTEAEAESVTVKIQVDNSAPLNDIVITSEKPAKIDAYNNKYTFQDEERAKEYTYGKYYKDDVKFKAYIKDKSVDSEKIVVTDNGNVIDVNWIKLEDKDEKNEGWESEEITVSSEGEHKIVISSIDKAGNVSEPAEVSFEIDKTAPVISSKINGESYTSGNRYLATADVKFDVNVDDKNEDVTDLTRTYSLTDFATDTVVESATDKISYSDRYATETYTENGIYQLSYKAVDKAGNVGTFELKSLYLDDVKPVADIEVTSDKPAKFSKYKNTYSDTASYAYPSGLTYEYGQYYNQNVNLRLKVSDYIVDEITVTDNGVDVTPEFTKEKPGVYSADLTISSEGSHQIKISMVNLAGVSSDTHEVSFTIDRTAPSITTTLNGNPVSNGDAVRYLTVDGVLSANVYDANEDADDLTRTVRMTRAGYGSAEVSEGKVAEGSDTYTTEADYSVSFVAVDRAGNVSATVTIPFRVDKTAPVLSITGANKGGVSQQTLTISYNIAENFYSDITSATVDVYKKVDGSAEIKLRTVTLNPTSNPYSLSEIFNEDGEYRFDFKATDKAGNNSAYAYSFKLDKTAPVIALSGVKNYDKTKEPVTIYALVEETFFETNTIQLTGTRKDIDGKVHDIKFEEYPINSSSEASFEQTFTEDGIYDITVTSKDAAGNTSTQSLHFTIDKTAPVIGNLEKYDNKTIKEFVWNEDDSIVKDLTACNVTIYLDGTEYDGLTKLEDGAHTLKVEAVDELGNSSVKEVTFTLDTIPPVIMVSGIEDKDVIKESRGIKVSLQLNTDVLYLVTLNGKEMTIVDGVASFTVDKPGEYKLVAKAYDAAGNETITELHFTFKKKVNVVMVVSSIVAILALLGIIFLLAKRRKKDDEK